MWCQKHISQGRWKVILNEAYRWTRKLAQLGSNNTFTNFTGMYKKTHKLKAYIYICTYDLHMITCLLDLLQFESTQYPFLSSFFYPLRTLKGLHHESNNKCRFVQIHWWRKLYTAGKFIHYFAYGLEIPLITIERNLTHTWIWKWGDSKSKPFDS